MEKTNAVYEMVNTLKGCLREVKQYYTKTLKPTYNNSSVKGLDSVKRNKDYYKKYYQLHKDYYKKYSQSEKGKEVSKKASKKYYQLHKDYYKKYSHQLCNYNGETLKLCTLSARFHKAGIKHPTIEAKKYLIKV